MSIFRNPNDEEKLCQALRAFVQEWGAELVIVSLPRSWRSVGPCALGRVRVEINTSHFITIHAGYEHVEAKFEIELAMPSNNQRKDSLESTRNEESPIL